MLHYPVINPVAFHMGPLSVHWYGLMYAVGFLSAWGLAAWRAHQPNSGWKQEQINDLIFYCALGVILGGRIGYMVFYDWRHLLVEPLSLFKIWQGGMSFHGGFIGVMLAVWLYGRKIGQSFLAIGDFIAPLVPIGLGAGRIGNFINGELWGRLTTVPWGMIYPQAGPQPRHPSEIYEFLLEGVLLFIILWWFSAKPKPRGAVSGLFFIGYGAFRFFAEFFRQPDPQLGFVAFGWMTRGQELSLPMILIGIAIMIWAYRSQPQGNQA